MPALPPVSKVVRMDFHFTEASDANVQIRKFFEYAGVLSQADAQAWASAASTSMGAHITPSLVTGCNLVNTVLTDLSSSSAPQAQDATAHNGANGTDNLPTGVALIIKAKVARRYRGGHPKVYLPGMRQTNVTSSNLWNTTFTASFLTLWNSFVSDILTNVPAAAAPATEVNVSYFQGFTNVTNPITGRQRSVPKLRVSPVVDTVLAHSVNPVPASQRRRNENP